MAASCGHHACSLDLVGDSQNEACHFAVADHHHLAQHLNPIHKSLLIADTREMGYLLFMQCLAITPVIWAAATQVSPIPANIAEYVDPCMQADIAAAASCAHSTYQQCDA